MDAEINDIGKDEISSDLIIQNNLQCDTLLRHQIRKHKNVNVKEEHNASLKRVSSILQKVPTDRTLEEKEVLSECSDIVDKIRERWRKRDEAKRRLVEFEDSAQVLQEKCQLLAQAVAQSQHLVVYTGAGISTAADIPDYRGPNGIWTRLQQGKEIGQHDLSSAEPTFTHMALAELYRRNILKYVVSQNCDGLHLRSGLPRIVLSELHGNMYVEVCKTCKPHKEYWRLFDVTENTARYSHKTYRKCYTCNSPLIDTIVHFGERGSLQWPLNWSGACKNAAKATTILCLGSSLKVLKRYPWLWQMDKPAKKRPNLYIVNLQWTPKDDVANMKINGKCDMVMSVLMKILDIKVPLYSKSSDPIFVHSTPLCELEVHTTTHLSLQMLNNNVELKNCNNKNERKDCNVSDLKTFTNEVKARDTSHCSKNVENNSNEKPSACSFSIDRILETTSTFKVTTPITFTSKAPFSFSNSNSTKDRHSAIFSSYSFEESYNDFVHYPYQTSWLYSGLHNIIDPVLYNEDKSSEFHTKYVEKKYTICEYCNKNYETDNCLFYTATEPLFINQEYRYSKSQQKKKPNSCICCDYSTDEENQEMIDSKEGATDDTWKNKPQSAGWFGKGYKKNRRFRKKQS